jgi:hypothetical protein
VGLREKDGLRVLTRLEAAGLVTRDGRGWRAHPEVLRDAVSAAAPARSEVDHGDLDPDTATVLRTFMPEGRLGQMPAARGKRLVVLDHIARIFEPGVRYPERDVNAMLAAFYDDYAALRRYLVDEGFLAREQGEYWRVGGSVEV